MMLIYKYEIIVYWSENDQLFIAVNKIRSYLPGLDYLKD